MPKTLLNSSYEPYTQYGQIIIGELFKNRNGDIAIRFRMPGRRIKVNSLVLPILTQKLVAMTTTLEPS